MDLVGRSRVLGVRGDVRSGSDKGDHDRDEREQANSDPGNLVIEVGRHEVVSKQRPQVAVDVEAPAEHEQDIEVSNEVTSERSSRPECEEKEGEQQRPGLPSACAVRPQLT